MDAPARRPPSATPDTTVKTVVRTAVVAVYLAVLAFVWKRHGIPLERLQVLLWVCGALFLATVGRAGAGPVRLLRDWLPIGLLLAAYDLSRGVADTLGMPVQMRSLVQVERLVTFGHVPTVAAQERFGPYVGAVRWWEVPVALVYLSHFVVPFAVLGVLWAVRRPLFRRYRDTLLLLTGVGLLTYVLLPAAPPWMASDAGLIGPVQRVGLRGMEPFGLSTAGVLVDYGGRFGNAVAALPSLHAGWSCMTACFFARRTRNRWWPLLVSYPAMMGVALVISGEHYLVDVLLGYLYAVAAVISVEWVHRRSAQGRRRRAAERRVAALDRRAHPSMDQPAEVAEPA